jgi:hypothetical protein
MKKAAILACFSTAGKKKQKIIKSQVFALRKEGKKDWVKAVKEYVQVKNQKIQLNSIKMILFPLRPILHMLEGTY